MTAANVRTWCGLDLAQKPDTLGIDRDELLCAEISTPEQASGAVLLSAVRRPFAREATPILLDVARLASAPKKPGFERVTTPSGFDAWVRKDRCGCTGPGGFPIDHGDRCPQRLPSALAIDTPATSSSVPSSDSAQACRNAATSSGEDLAAPAPNRASISLAAAVMWPAAARRALSSISSRVGMGTPVAKGGTHRTRVINRPVIFGWLGITVTFVLAAICTAILIAITSGAPT